MNTEFPLYSSSCAHALFLIPSEEEFRKIAAGHSWGFLRTWSATRINWKLFSEEICALLCMWNRGLARGWFIRAAYRCSVGKNQCQCCRLCWLELNGFICVCWLSVYKWNLKTEMLSLKMRPPAGFSTCLLLGFLFIWLQEVLLLEKLL